MRTVKQIAVVRRSGTWVFIAGKSFDGFMIQPTQIERRKVRGQEEVGFYSKSSKRANARETAYIFPSDWLRQLHISGLHVTFGEMRKMSGGGMKAVVTDASLYTREVRRRKPR